MDPDQDLLDQLDRREAGGPYMVVALVCGLAILAALVTYFTLTMALRTGPQVARDSAILAFIASAALLGIRYRRFR